MEAEKSQIMEERRLTWLWRLRSLRLWRKGDGDIISVWVWRPQNQRSLWYKYQSKGRQNWCSISIKQAGRKRVKFFFPLPFCCIQALTGWCPPTLERVILFYWVLWFICQSYPEIPLLTHPETVFNLSTHSAVQLIHSINHIRLFALFLMIPRNLFYILDQGSSIEFSVLIEMYICTTHYGSY